MNIKRRVEIVPRCPYCQSYRTGKKVLYTGYHNDQIIAQYMRRGILVRPSPFSTSQNMYCEDCEAEWAGEVTYAWLNKLEFAKLKELKGITKKGISEHDNSDIEAKLETRQKKKEARAAKVRSLFSKTKRIPKEKPQVSEEKTDNDSSIIIWWLKSTLKATFVTPLTDLIPKHRENTYEHKGLQDEDDI